MIVIAIFYPFFITQQHPV